MINRRGFLGGLIAAPVIVRASSLMAMPRAPWPPLLLRADGRLVCNGALLRVADFPDLFSVLGNSYGGDEGRFRLPDLPCAPSQPFQYLISTAQLPDVPVGMLTLSI